MEDELNSEIYDAYDFISIGWDWIYYVSYVEHFRIVETELEDKMKNPFFRNEDYRIYLN